MQPFNLSDNDTRLPTLLTPTSITVHSISYTQHPHQRQPNNQKPPRRQAPRQPRTAKVPRLIALPRTPKVDVRFLQTLIDGLLGHKITGLAVLEARFIIAIELGFGDSAARFECLVVVVDGGVEGGEAGGLVWRVNLWELVEALAKRLWRGDERRH